MRRHTVGSRQTADFLGGSYSLCLTLGTHAVGSSLALEDPPRAILVSRSTPVFPSLHASKAIPVPVHLAVAPCVVPVFTWLPLIYPKSF